MNLINRIDKESRSITSFNIESLYKIAPSCFTEAKGEDGEVHKVVSAYNK